MTLTRKQKKEIHWADMLDKIAGGKNKSETGNQMRRRVRNKEMKKYK